MIRALIILGRATRSQSPPAVPPRHLSSARVHGHEHHDGNQEARLMPRCPPRLLLKHSSKQVSHLRAWRQGRRRRRRAREEPPSIPSFRSEPGQYHPYRQSCASGSWWWWWCSKRKRGALLHSILGRLRSSSEALCTPGRGIASRHHHRG